MLDLRRLRLLRELHERETIAAVADALQFTPSAVSQQLAMLEREAGVPLLERAGRGVRLTDPALVLVEHADALLERVAARRGRPGGRRRRRCAAVRGSRRSSRSRCGSPCPRWSRWRATRRSCAASSSRPSPSGRCRPLALGDVDLVLGDEWQHQPRAAAERSRAPRARPRPGPRRTARRATRSRSRTRSRATRRARRRDVDDRPRGDGLGRDDAPHVPRARRASTPTSATARTTRSSASRSSRAGSR